MKFGLKVKQRITLLQLHNLCQELGLEYDVDQDLIVFAEVMPELLEAKE